jgi:glutamate/aspartate transport system substrate-binding protein
MKHAIAALGLALTFGAGSPAVLGADSRIDRIAETKTITIAYRPDATPFSFVNDEKQITGYSIDLCKQVVANIQRQLGLSSLEIKWLPVTVQTRFSAVANGDADMECGSSTVTLSRLKQVDFSSYIFLETTGVLTKTAAKIRSLLDLAGKRISVIAGTTNERAVRAVLAEKKIDATIVTFPSREGAFNALIEDKADAFASDKLLLVGAVSQSKGQDFFLLPESLSFEPYGIALPRGDADMRLAINGALSRIYESGQIRSIHGTWFRQFGEPGDILKVMYLMGIIPD